MTNGGVVVGQTGKRRVQVLGDVRHRRRTAALLVLVSLALSSVETQRAGVLGTHGTSSFIARPHPCRNARPCGVDKVMNEGVPRIDGDGSGTGAILYSDTSHDMRKRLRLTGSQIAGRCV